MGRFVRASAVLAASVLAVPVWAVPSASAAELSEAAQYGAYFSSTGVSQQGLPAESPLPPPNATADADGVAPGNLAVAASGTQEEKVSFLFFALADVPLDATITKAVLSVPLVPDEKPRNVVLNASPDFVRACKSGPEGFFGDDAQALRLAPQRLCGEFASEPAKLSADGKAYEFDITGLAATWLTANDGVALTVAELSAQPFQVVFAPADQARLALTYTGGTPLVETPLPTVDSGSVPLAGGFGFDSGASLPTFDTGGFGSVAAPVVDSALPALPDAAAAGPEPAVAQPQAVVPVAATMPDVSSVPSLSFWAGLALLAGVLALLGLIMGDPRVPAPTAAARQTRLGQALAGRQAATSPARRPQLHRPLGI
jgi:hypothetical protein